MRVCPTRDGKQVPLNAPKGYAPKKIHFYGLQSRGSEPDKGDDDDSKFLYFFFSVMSSL